MFKRAGLRIGLKGNICIHKQQFHLMQAYIIQKAISAQNLCAIDFEAVELEIREHPGLG